MSQANWIVTLGRVNFLGGILAARSDEHAALMQLQSCVDTLEWAVYDRRLQASPDAVMADCFDFDAASAPHQQVVGTRPIGHLRFSVYTPDAPCPDLPAPTARGSRLKGRTRVQKLKSQPAMTYNAIHVRDDTHTKGGSGGGVQGAATTQCGHDAPAAAQRLA